MQSLSDDNYIDYNMRYNNKHLSVSQKMNEVTLLKQYIKTLQSENQAKNTQRQTLYKQLQQLSQQNNYLNGQLAFLSNTNQQSKQDFIVVQMQMHISNLQHQLNNLVNVLKFKDNQMVDLVYQRDMTEQRVIGLQDKLTDYKSTNSRIRDQVTGLEQRIQGLVEQMQEARKEIQGIRRQRDGVKSELAGVKKDRDMYKAERDILKSQRDNLKLQLNTLKSQTQKTISQTNEQKITLQHQLSQLHHKYNQLLSQMEHQQQQPNTQQRINKLIQNYEKIEQLARQKTIQNEQIKQQIEQLKNQLLVKNNQLYTLNQHLEACQVELVDFRKAKREGRDGSMGRNFNGVGVGARERERERDRKGLSDDVFMNINLIRQNNRLIQRVTQLEKEKNMLYADVLESSWKRDNREAVSPGLTTTRSATGQQRSQLKSRIYEIKIANQALLENLRI